MDGMITECPECGAELVARLGILECTECSYLADSEEQAARDREQGASRSYRDPRTDRHKLNDLLSGVGSSNRHVPRATRNRR